MRILGGLSLTMLFAGALLAQHPGGRSGGSNGGVHRGGGYHLSGSGLVGSGYRGSSVVVIPYVYPGYVGGGYYSYPPDYSAGYTDGSYAPAPAPPQPVMIVVPQQPAPAMVNQFGPGDMPPAGSNPEPMSPYQPSTAQADEQPSTDHYLIALKDHSIYSVVAYWVDGDTLHYFTAGNVHNQASLSLVDRDLTARLNKESGNLVNLPASK